MAYDLMNTADLMKEIRRRVSINIDDWANKINLEKAKYDLEDKLDKSEKFFKEKEVEIKKATKSNKILSNITTISFIASIISCAAPFVVKFCFNNTEIYKNGFIPFMIFAFLTLFFAGFPRTTINLKNEHFERAEVLYWYYFLLQEACLKNFIKKYMEILIK